MKTTGIMLGTGLLLLILGAGYLFLNQKTPTPAKVTPQNPTPSKTNQQAAALNPPKTCKEPTPSQTEGPYYKAGSPEKSNLQEETIPGEPITVTGFVLDANCQPIKNAWIDFWQADGNGEYDNQAYKLRGHQYTDSEGKYVLKTVIPGEYPGRTPHIHVKVKPTEESNILTTQLYFPQSANANASDSIYTAETLLEIKENGEKVGYYNFYLTQ